VQPDATALPGGAPNSGRRGLRLQHLEFSLGFGVNRTMKNEDASRIASSLERIATGFDQLNEL
jgi:hypothetical protein